MAGLPKGFPPVVWARIRRRWAKSTEPKAILLPDGPRWSTIVARARAEKWGPRRGGLAHGAASKPTKPKRVLTRRQFIRRLRRLIDLKLRRLEVKLEGDTEIKDPEAERQTKEMIAVARLFEKLDEQEKREKERRSRAARTTKSSRKADAIAMEEADAERWRHALAERLERLRDKLKDR